LILFNFTIHKAHNWDVLNFFKRSALKIGCGLASIVSARFALGWGVESARQALPDDDKTQNHSCRLAKVLNYLMWKTLHS